MTDETHTRPGPDDLDEAALERIVGGVEPPEPDKTARQRPTGVHGG